MYLIVPMVILHHLEIPKDQQVKENALIVDNNVLDLYKIVNVQITRKQC